MNTHTIRVASCDFQLPFTYHYGLESFFIQADHINISGHINKVHCYINFESSPHEMQGCRAIGGTLWGKCPELHKVDRTLFLFTAKQRHFCITEVTQNTKTA